MTTLPFALDEVDRSRSAANVEELSKVQDAGGFGAYAFLVGTEAAKERLAELGFMARLITETPFEGIGYVVLPEDPNELHATLYRPDGDEEKLTARLMDILLFAAGTDYQKVTGIPPKLGPRRLDNDTRIHPETGEFVADVVVVDPGTGKVVRELTADEAATGVLVHRNGPLGPPASPDVTPTATATVPVAHILRSGTRTKARRLRWLWPGYLPLLPVMLDGEPSLGKSTVTVDWAARLTAGVAMPDGYIPPEPGLAIVISSEDAWEHTIKPRFVAHGGDLERVFFLEPEAVFSIPDRLDSLTRDLEELRAVHPTAPILIVVDPLIAFLDSNLNTWKDQDVRLAFARMTPVCERYRCAIVGLRHLKKEKGVSAVNAGGGSIGMIAAVRTGLIIAIHPDDHDLSWDPETEVDPRRRVLAVTKMNVAKFAPSRTFTIVPAEDFDLDGVRFTGDDIARIEWGDSSGLTADALVKEPHHGKTGPKTGVQEEAEMMLTVILQDGPKLGSDVLEEIMHESAASKATVTRARKKLGIITKKAREENGAWWWALPMHEYRLLEQLGLVPPGTAAIAEEPKKLIPW